MIREYGPERYLGVPWCLLAVTAFSLQFSQALPDAGEQEVTGNHALIARNLTQKERKSMAASSQAARSNC